MKVSNILYSIVLLVFVSCAVNMRTASVPKFSYGEADFIFDSPRDIELKLKPKAGDVTKWLLNVPSEHIMNEVVPLGADLNTILEVVFPDGDAFKYGKVVNQKNQLAIPLPPSGLVIKDETDLYVRALKVGKHKYEETFKEGKSIFVKHSKEPIKNMVFVQGGTFQMGSNSGDDDEQPIHTVTVSSFYMDKTEVTQAEYRKVMGKNPSHFSGCDDCPVESVSWHDANAYAKKVGKRLPTEAEWEYAARGGNKSKGYTYSGSNDLDAVGWYDNNSGSKSHPVAQKQPNELGLYDMSGNVWEWCWDWYGDYSSSSQTDPQGSNSGEYRVLRGGDWYGLDYYCRVANRSGDLPSYRNDSSGFRLVLSQDL